MRRPVRIANCSGFYGDRLAAAREMLAGPIDVLTGDYLAELTMLILWKARRKDPSLGYATTFLRQMEDVLGTCLERGVKVVSNAGGLNPEGLARKITELAARLGLNARVAYITGDDLAPAIGELQAAGHEFTNLDTGLPLTKADLPVVTANAYLGGWGIAAALQAGADVVICPRVTDASLVTGPAAWWHGWRRDDWDALAGAVAAGHVIECGPQATGGNYSFLDEITQRRYPGFPIAEVAADGSSIITKHEGTGGLVSTGTVTAQLLYEIGPPAYLNPDVIAHFDTIGLEQAGTDRVELTGTRGSPPPDTLKVALNMLGGYRNTTTMVLTGLDIEQKAEHATSLLFEVLGGDAGSGQFAETDVRLLRFDRPDAPTNEQATAHLRITVKDPDEAKVGRAFSNAAIELALAGYPGFHTTSPPGGASAFGVYWPALIPAALVTQQVHLPDGSTLAVPHHADPAAPPASLQAPHDGDAGPDAVLDAVATADIPLGRLCGARSGDKGGDANVGLWATSPQAYAWLRRYLTTGRLRELLTEAAALPVDRYELPNLLAVNFVIHGLLAPGVSATTRPDAQAKGLGEYLRSRTVRVPADLITKIQDHLSERPVVRAPGTVRAPRHRRHHRRPRHHPRPRHHRRPATIGTTSTIRHHGRAAVVPVCLGARRRPAAAPVRAAHQACHVTQAPAVPTATRPIRCGCPSHVSRCAWRRHSRLITGGPNSRHTRRGNGPSGPWSRANRARHASSTSASVIERDADSARADISAARGNT